MGWWSKDIMGGDSPLDAKDLIFGICEVDEFPEDDSIVTLKKSDFEKHEAEILKRLREEKNNQYYDERAIAFQVLGVLMMKAGAPISEELKAEILENSETDSWAKEDSERKAIVENFHTALKNYNGKPIEIKSKGLFEVIDDYLSSGHTGLVNTGPGIE